MKKRWLFIILGVGLLTLALTGGAILAQGPTTGGDGSRQSIMSRVAEILGLDEGTVEDAFNQAVREEQDDALAQRLSRLVENEKITQAEADQISEWFVRRPDVTVRMLRLLFVGEDGLQNMLNRMVESGRITQDDADAVMSWFQDRPDAVQSLERFRKHRGDGSTDGAPGERLRPSGGHPEHGLGRQGPRPDAAGILGDGEGLQRLLSRLVDSGEITQDQADEIQAWISEKPDFLPNVGQWALLGEGVLKQRLDLMVQNGRIDQAQADAALEWFRDRPAGIQSLNQFFHDPGQQGGNRPSDARARPSGQARMEGLNRPGLRPAAAGNFQAPAPESPIW